MTQAQRNYEASRALVDEDRIGALLEDLPALLTSDEQAKLRECARLSVEQHQRAAEVGIEAARRSDTDAEECNRREAIGRYFMLLLFQCTEAAAAENMIEN